MFSSLAQGATVNSANVSVSISSAGTYQVSENSPSWQLKGSLGVPATGIAIHSGTDPIGTYEELSFNFSGPAGPMAGTIRLYSPDDVLLFSQSNAKASLAAPAPFPNFTTIPASLYRFSYQNGAFSPPVFKLQSISTPWLLFDSQDHAMLISPASHFLCASMVGDGSSAIGSGFSATLKNLPAGFTQQTLLVLSDGINHAWDLWGRALTNLQGKKRPANDADPILKYYGYWTDNGAAYWYNYDPSKGYQGTLQAVVDEYRAGQIPLRYLQLDSWWYFKTTTQPNGKPGKPKNTKLPAGEWNRYGGTTEYKAHPFVFPKGLEAFHEASALPFITHNRWIDPESPYHQRYKISGIAAVDPSFWDEIAGYLKANGVIAYEQDWLNQILLNSPALASTPDLGDAFFDGMARACARNGLSLQYCMGTPPCFLQGSKYSNLTSIRVSDDRFCPPRYHDFLYVSRLASALGIWPWVDVFKSTETSNLLLATLSAGPVGTGDALGLEDKDNILESVRADGVIVKPDAPLIPVDATYLTEAQGRRAPMIAVTYTQHSRLKTIYCVAISGQKDPSASLSVARSELGCPDGPIYIYNWFAGAGLRLDAAADIPISVPGGACAYRVIAPIGPSGIALLGDAGKFVGMGKSRIPMARDENGALTCQVALAPQEHEVKLHGYASAAPKVSVRPGKSEPVLYDASTGLFSIVLKPDIKGSLTIADGEPAHLMNVVLRCPPTH